MSKKSAMLPVPTCEFWRFAYASRKQIRKFDKKKKWKNGVLNCITLEHLEYRYYQTSLNLMLITAADRVIFQKSEDMIAHVKFLPRSYSNVLKGNTRFPEPDFDFTAKRKFLSIHRLPSHS